MKFTLPARLTPLLAACLYCLSTGIVSAGSASADTGDDTGWFGTSKIIKESPVVFPGAPQDLLHVHVTDESALQFFIDRKSLAVQPGNTVRYTLVAKAGQGPSNVSYEGLDCAQRRWKLYAVWNEAEKKWTPAGGSDWQRIPESGATRIHSTLYNDDFCKDFTVNGSADDILRRVQQGLRAIPRID